MKQGFFEIRENIPLTENVFKMTLEGDCSAITAPGQFVNIKLDGLYLRRPISVCDAEGERLTLIYKVVGKGTEKMSQMKTGTLDLLSGLGNGYDLEKSGSAPRRCGSPAALSSGKRADKAGQKRNGDTRLQHKERSIL